MCNFVCLCFVKNVRMYFATNVSMKGAPPFFGQVALYVPSIKNGRGQPACALKRMCQKRRGEKKGACRFILKYAPQDCLKLGHELHRRLVMRQRIADLRKQATNATWGIYICSYFLSGKIDHKKIANEGKERRKKGTKERNERTMGGRDKPNKRTNERRMEGINE